MSVRAPSIDPADEAEDGQLGGSDQPFRMLVYVGLDYVGDGLMKLPFLRALRHGFPDAEIVWLAGKGKSAYKTVLRPLVQHLVDIVVDEAEIGLHWTELFARPLPSQHFGLVIDTQRRVLTTLILRRIAADHFLSGAADFAFSDFKPSRPHVKPPSMLGQLLELVTLATGQTAVPDAELRLGDDVTDAAHRLLPPGIRYVGLAPGAGGKHKCWPLQNFATLGRMLAQAGRQPVFFLGPEELEWFSDLSAAVPTALFPLQTPLAQHFQSAPHLTIALARRLRAAVANDSGGGHMLAAADIPLISLFGPTDPVKFAPATRRLIVIRAQSYGGGDAMTQIPLPAVAQALDRLIG